MSYVKIKPEELIRSCDKTLRHTIPMNIAMEHIYVGLEYEKQNKHYHSWYCRLYRKFFQQSKPDRHDIICNHLGKIHPNSRKRLDLSDKLRKIAEDTFEDYVYVSLRDYEFLVGIR